MHGPDLTGIALIAVAATLCGMMMVRLKQPPIVGYILAGVVLGPSALGLVENRETINLLAELGIIMLLYFVGMELSLRAFRHIWKIALITSMVQILASVAAVYGVGVWLGWPFEWALLFGFCLALSSTAVAINVLEDSGDLRNNVGKVAVGVLIAQDLAVAPMLVIISNLSGEGLINPVVIFEVALSVGLLLLFILVLTRRTKVNLPFHQLTMQNPALTPLVALTWCFAFATLAGLIGLSPAFGAFLAGLIVGNSAQRAEVHENAVPVQAVLMMVFFLSVGLLIDLPFVWANLGLLLALWAATTVFKTALNTALLRVQGQSWQTSFQVSLVIGQLGEFSFLLAAAGLSAAVIDQEVHRMIVALTVISLVMSPIYTDLSHRLHHRAAKNIGSLGGLLKFAYVREWRVTKRASRAAVALAFRSAASMQDKVEDGRAERRARRAARGSLSPETASGGKTPFDLEAAARRIAPAPQAGPRRKQARARVADAIRAADAAVAEGGRDAPRAAAPNTGPSQDASPLETPGGKAAPKKADRKKAASKKAAAKKTAAKPADSAPSADASPMKAQSKKAGKTSSGKETAPKKTTPKKAVGKKAAGKKAAGKTAAGKSAQARKGAAKGERDPSTAGADASKPGDRKR
ncbi:MAG: cation:proton antiporter [Marivibrio sp.]|uniref:cation:proton antiporter n=1 Tax=Marivibrio sp. TaxID=2039719 RepID=UPI0032F0201E